MPRPYIAHGSVQCKGTGAACPLLGVGFQLADQVGSFIATEGAEPAEARIHRW